jgi:hypothetical protein
MLSLMTLPALAGVTALGLLDSEAALLFFLGALGLSSGLTQTVTAAVWAEVYGVA